MAIDRAELRAVALSGRDWPEVGDERVDETAVHYRALFAAAPTPYLILTPDLMICEVNHAYLEPTGRQRADFIGRHIFDAFPDNSEDPDADGVRNLNASLQRALATRAPDVMALQKYDIPVNGGGFEERWWSPINTPVLNEAGRVMFLIHRVEDATAYVRARGLNRNGRRSVAGGRAAAADLEVDLIAGARKLQELNQQLREANAREHEVAVRLQRAMLPAAVSSTSYSVAVRYLPADPLQVCGDWYDVAELSDTRLSVSVGDVVGHGLRAAAVMGQLRSALIAATLGVEGPGKALEVLDRFARTIDGATTSTAVQAVVDKASHTITYSSAGHLPPMLVRHSGDVELLDASSVHRRAHRTPPRNTRRWPLAARRQSDPPCQSRTRAPRRRHPCRSPDRTQAFDDTALVVVQVSGR